MNALVPVSVSRCEGRLSSLCYSDARSCVLLGVFAGLKEVLKAVEKLSMCLESNRELDSDKCFYVASESLSALHSIMHDLRPLVSHLGYRRVLEEINHCISVVKEVSRHSPAEIEEVKQNHLLGLRECAYRIKNTLSSLCGY